MKKMELHSLLAETFLAAAKQSLTLNDETARVLGSLARLKKITGKTSEAITLIISNLPPIERFNAASIVLQSSERGSTVHKAAVNTGLAAVNDLPGMHRHMACILLERETDDLVIKRHCMQKAFENNEHLAAASRPFALSVLEANSREFPTLHKKIVNALKAHEGYDKPMKGTPSELSVSDFVTSMKSLTP